VRLHVTRYLCGSPIFNSVLRLGISRCGLPKKLGPLVPVLRRQQPQDLKLILTVLNLTRLDLGDGTLNTESIESPPTYKPDKVKVISERMVRKLQQLELSNKIVKVRSSDVTWVEPHLTTKKGPTGHALRSATHELAMLPKSLMDDIKLMGGDKITSYINDISELAHYFNKVHQIKNNNTFRRISVIKDKELKNRPIAILDYWSQTVLKPLHDNLMIMLKKLRTDLTYSQDRCKSIAKFMARGTYRESTSPTYYSFDLTSATDRFPLIVQQYVLTHILGEEKAGAWGRIMTG